jgi:hypothetical protein
MVCGKCRHEFCWSCLGSYYSYTHAEQRYCPARYSMLVFTIMLLIILLNQKLFYFSTYYYSFQYYLVKCLFACALIDIMAFSLIFYLPLLATIFDCSQYNSTNKAKRVLALLGILVALTVHSVFVYLSCYTDDYPYLWFSVRCLFWELAVALAGGIIVAIFYLGNKLYRWIRSHKNKRQEILRKCE